MGRNGWMKEVGQKDGWMKEVGQKDRWMMEGRMDGWKDEMG